MTDSRHWPAGERVALIVDPAGHPVLDPTGTGLGFAGLAPAIRWLSALPVTGAQLALAEVLVDPRGRLIAGSGADEVIGCPGRLVGRMLVARPL